MGKTGNWLIVGASIRGRSHVVANRPCQDSMHHELGKKGWGVAVVCDGAGSAPLSELGAAFAVKEAVTVFANKLRGLAREKKLPEDGAWAKMGFEGFRALRNALFDYAEELSVAPDALACTVIVAIFHPKGLLIAHIGDGRAAYCSANGEWRAMMTPHKGQEINETLFLTSGGWPDGGWCQRGVEVPECRVIREPIHGFALMTDGCEKHAFEVSGFEEGGKRWRDPNNPFPGFFQPLTRQLLGMSKEGAPDIQVNTQWERFLETGTAGLREEQDDKTMFLGILRQ